MFRRMFQAFPELPGEGIVLRFRDRSLRDRSQGIKESITYDICLKGSDAYAGYISLRLGESPEIYYLGHIGYRVEEPYRGHGLAARAVRAMMPLIRENRFASLTITTDPDNIPSRKTCERLGCILESIVPVPRRYRPLCMNSPAKCRFILLTAEPAIEERTAQHDSSG